MFKPTPKDRRLLTALNCSAAYIYPDGIVIKEQKSFRVGKGTQARVEIAHVYHCEIKILHNGADNLYPRRIVVHRPQMLVHGVWYVRVYYGEQSEAMKRRDIKATRTIIYTPEGGEISDTHFNFLSADLIVQPNLPEVDTFCSMSGYPVKMSVDDWSKDGHCTYIDELPHLVQTLPLLAEQPSIEGLAEVQP